MRRDTRHGRASESRRKFDTVVTTNLTHAHARAWFVHSHASRLRRHSIGTKLTPLTGQFQKPRF